MASELIIVEVTGSTNDDVMELARAGAPHGTAVASHRQAKGRGRRGHAWSSGEGGLYLSVLLRPAVAPSRLSALSAVLCLASREAVLGVFPEVRDIMVKWPNDLVCDKGKLAGLLLEAGSDAAGPFVVAGQGNNLTRLQDAAPTEGETDVPSVAALAPCWLSDLGCADAVGRFDELARAVRDQMVADCDRWARDLAALPVSRGPLAPVLDRYNGCLAMRSQCVRALRPEGVEQTRGHFAGVDSWGRAHLVLDDGADVAFTAEQVSLRPCED